MIMGVDGKERAAMLSLQERTIHVIEGASIRHIEEFRKPDREQ